jgi:predicted phosphate transport protein (TIGR00153 family)
LPVRFLLPQEGKFFDLLDEAAEVLTRAADKFLALVTQFDNVPERARDMKQEETRCDEVVARIFTALDLTFITPFDREDIHNLATSLDDVLDNMEETAYRFLSFRIDRPTPEAVALARIIREACDHLCHAVRACRNLKKHPGEIQANLREITRLENEADRIYRDTDGALFANGAGDILTLIKWRELYAWLEETVDACKDASQAITEILVKGS